MGLKNSGTDSHVPTYQLLGYLDGYKDATEDLKILPLDCVQNCSNSLPSNPMFTESYAAGYAAKVAEIA